MSVNNGSAESATVEEARPNVVVTGAARRIGRAIAEDLAAQGWGVALHFEQSRIEAEELAHAIEGRGAGRAVALQADLTDMDQAASLFQRAAAALGPVSVVVNNASIFEDDTVETLDWQAFDRHFAIHVKAPVELARSLAASLGEGREGLVVNLIDQRVWKPAPVFFSYGLSKATLWDATRMLAQALAPRVRVNAIGPGPTLQGARQTSEDFRRQVDSVLLRRGPALDEFAATIRYLWEARSVTGQMIALDGGQHLAWATADVAGIRE
jgi:NAD(P)-dependent dehydrogenase (short-subunit alcohol dehydrogenase family)